MTFLFVCCNTKESNLPVNLSVSYNNKTEDSTLFDFRNNPFLIQKSESFVSLMYPMASFVFYFDDKLNLINKINVLSTIPYAYNVVPIGFCSVPDGFAILDYSTNSIIILNKEFKYKSTVFIDAGDMSSNTFYKQFDLEYSNPPVFTFNSRSNKYSFEMKNKTDSMVYKVYMDLDGHITATDKLNPIGRNKMEIINNISETDTFREVAELNNYTLYKTDVSKHSYLIKDKTSGKVGHFRTDFYINNFYVKSNAHELDLILVDSTNSKLIQGKLDILGLN